MEELTFPLKYTICFVVAGDKILVIRRRKPPYVDMWNGLGGKIEGNETHRENILREMKEEAGLDLTTTSLQYVGNVTWDSTREDGRHHGGMYAYVAYVPASYVFPDKDTREGILSWKDKAWLCDKKNSEVAENIPYFLPYLLSETRSKAYRCTYVYGKLTKFEVSELVG